MALWVPCSEGESNINCAISSRSLSEFAPMRKTRRRDLRVACDPPSLRFCSARPCAQGRSRGCGRVGIGRKMHVESIQRDGPID
jgi:hypothetical protein